MVGRTVRNADGWTDIKMQTVTFTTLQTILKFSVFHFLIDYAYSEIRIFLDEQKMALEHFTYLLKAVHRLIIVQ
jgi:hypothetical protein